ncbi:DUF998 domain-containing protein [Catelliglobosispora koreensis]|uniref:DUF998 domain-containing protein n=1 Tax=Catelliglobosispora koreensis TaxID=129052 RepID=UPI0003612486|nr:DUF998 domain-containing protein [Catelliglobosispora koreensis]
MTTTIVTSPGALPAITRPSTRLMLTAGVLAGPLFLVTILIQQATRAGVDPVTQPLSLLSLGENGWIQITNFIVSGLLVLASAVGIRRTLRGGPAGTWGPILIAVYGVALVWGGVFVADPASGFPAGAAMGVPDPSTWSWHSWMHAFAAPAMGLSLIAACFVFARAFRRQGKTGWAVLSWAAAAGYFVVAGTGFGTSDFRLVLAGGGLLWLWAAAVSAHLLHMREKGSA